MPTTPSALTVDCLVQHPGILREGFMGGGFHLLGKGRIRCQKAIEVTTACRTAFQLIPGGLLFEPNHGETVTQRCFEKGSQCLGGLHFFLSYVDWVAEDPTAFATKVIAPDFHTVSAGFCRAIGAGLQIFPATDHFSIFDQADLGGLRQMCLQCDTAFGGNLIAHNSRLFQSLGFEGKAARGRREIIADETTSTG